ncbi:uncharacterized protein N0V89_006017 [Didymosphaeria variabile]|uniref:Uncharacterized protein n=1 Tax=Didymosphaeria variabile TaxID=1932322 RepID=A0A9W8XNA1_9PLEO|nr:uncharacterized protein N0V89_006017 [Didymosphaeria variabile]KAJ4354283.1 hypothetical protein N0V89_006017 [Didymosphaeria variabile]
MEDHLRFLDLPIEIREIIYQDLLCTWELKHNRERAFLSTRFNNPTAILRVNRQVYYEAYDYLVKHNQFIRVDCDGISIRSDPLGRQILPVTEDPEEVSQFNGYVARIKWTTNSDPLQKRSRKQYIVLGRQFPDILKATDYHIMTQWPAITMTITMDPISTDRAEVTTTSLRPFQTALLRTIPTFLHAFPGLSIQGSSVSRNLAARIIRETAEPRWTTPTAALSDILWFKHNNDRLGKEAYYLSTNTATECGLKTIDYMRSSPAWPKLMLAGGVDFANTVAELAFDLRVNRAQRALDAMERSQCRRNLVEEFATHVDADIGKCLLSVPSHNHQDTWSPSVEQVAIAMCMSARKYRLLLDAENRDSAVAAVEHAFQTFPENEMVMREKEAIATWSSNVDRYFNEVWVSNSGAVLEMWQWWEQEEKSCDC